MLGGMHARGRHGKGTCVAKGPAWPWGCACLGGVLPGGMHGRRDSHCSGWYASYWNAFLFLKGFDMRIIDEKKLFFVRKVSNKKDPNSREHQRYLQ